MPSKRIPLKTGSREAPHEVSQLTLVRPSRLAALLDCDRSTISRWQKTGVLPPAVQLGGVRGWPAHQIQQLLAGHRALEKTAGGC
jgi:predicted DNA-binding transcriptional regulator AlpA